MAIAYYNVRVERDGSVFYIRARDLPCHYMCLLSIFSGQMLEMGAPPLVPTHLLPSHLGEAIVCCVPICLNLTLSTPGKMTTLASSKERHRSPFTCSNLYLSMSLEGFLIEILEMFYSVDLKVVRNLDSGNL